MADSGTELSNKVKDQGNALFGKGKYAAAREAYTEAKESADRDPRQRSFIGVIRQIPGGDDLG